MRLIDADALIEVLNDNGVPYNADVNYFVTNAPTVDAVSVEWIPCEKRLPEETMLCLVTIKEQVTPIIDWWLADEPTTPDPVPGKWKDNKLTHIAWMPLMEPYEERRNNG